MQIIQFHTRGEFIELNKLLKATDVCSSGGTAGALITSGSVLVNGQVELRKACKIRPGQVVQTGAVQINVLPPK
jgi:ribosome-associated protein